MWIINLSIVFHSICRTLGIIWSKTTTTTSTTIIVHIICNTIISSYDTKSRIWFGIFTRQTTEGMSCTTLYGTILLRQTHTACALAGKAWRTVGSAPLCTVSWSVIHKEDEPNQSHTAQTSPVSCSGSQFRHWQGGIPDKRQFHGSSTMDFRASNQGCFALVFSS